MRKVIASSFVTLDGFMAGPQGELDWNEPYFDEEMATYISEQFRIVDTILYGHVTYELFAQYWPVQGVKDDPIFAEKMNSLPKIVFSRTLEKVEKIPEPMVFSGREQPVSACRGTYLPATAQTTTGG